MHANPVEVHTMRDPYQVLGVPRSADEKAIKSAFRKLAKKWHPDQNKDDPKAKERFAEVNQAYEIVGDKEKRAKFDAGEIDAEGKERFTGFGGGDPFGAGGPFGGGRPRGGGGGGGGFDAEDILSQMFSGMGAGGMGGMGGDPFGGARRQARPRPAPKGGDRKIELTVTLEQLAAGKAPVRLGPDRTVALKIPPEAQDGQTIRMRGQGEAGPGGAGDALVTLRIARHPEFVREGNNLRVHVPVPLAVAANGGKARVPTLTGAVALSVPEWSSSGTVLRVRGKGLPGRDGTAGDILAVVAIELPESREAAIAALTRTPKAATGS